MRSYLLAVVVFTLCLAPLVRADEQSPTNGKPTSTPIKIETRFATIPPDIAKACKQFGWGKEGLVPPASEAESLFSIDTVEDDGSAAIKLISASTMVAEQNPIFIETLSRQKMTELTKLFQQNTRTLIMFAPEVTVSDRDTAEIIDTRKRPFVVDVVNEKADVRVYEEGTTLLVRPSVKQSGSLQLDLLARFSQIEDVNVLQKDETRQIQSPRIKTTKIELSASLKPGETLAIWGGDLNTPEVTAPSTGIAKIIRKKPAVKNPKSSLVLLITPRILAEEVASTPGK